MIFTLSPPTSAHRMPSRNTQLTFAWILIAFIMLGVAAWQVQTTLAKDAAAKNAPLPPPLKTRHAIRPAAIAFNGDPLADYIARCEKGMTDQEIRWIIEDFKIAELDVEWRNPELPKERVLQLINRQQSWYLECLEDSLRLDRAQTEKARQSLGKLFRTAAEPYFSWREKASPEALGLHLNNFAWLPGDPWDEFKPEISFMPWNLCGLTAEQESITWRQWFDSRGKNAPLVPGHDGSGKTTKLTEIPEFLFSGPDSSATSNRFPPHWARLANSTFPLLVLQDLEQNPSADDPFAEPDPHRKEGLLVNIRRLHPAQLKLLLLFAPEMAAEISKELQAPSR